MIYEQLLDLEREARISNIARQLQSSEFAEVATQESISGNAGNNRFAVNAFAGKKSGEIIKFGNWQDVPRQMRDNPNFSEVTFIKDVGNSSRPSVGSEIAPARFTEVQNKKFDEGASPQAPVNIEETIPESINKTRAVVYR